jgi:hypothetical protein
MSHANRDRREERIIATTPCPACGARLGEKCREGTAPHDASRGVEDLRPWLQRVHRERRAAWAAGKSSSS